MTIPRQAMVVLAAATLLGAPASATWYAHGSFEPDTSYDDESWMWPAAPAPGEEKVYFNAITSTRYTTVSGKPALNPNVGMLHTQIEPAGVERHWALLGVWVDCNGDGYVGMAESALREYSAELLMSQDVCPGVTGPVTRWTAGAHNYNGWVSELVPISRGAQLSDARVYRDDDTRVWGDFHRPDEKPFHRSCALRPFPRGTLETTGGLINYVDCRVDVLGNFNNAMGTINDPLGLRFSDADDARSGPLGQVQLFGPESDEHALVKTADCDAERIHVGDTGNQTPLGPHLPHAVANNSVARPDVSAGPAFSDPSKATVPGQLNQTNEEWLGDCDTSNDFGHDFYGNFEASFNGVNPDNKTEADWNFGFSTVSRGTLPWGLLIPLALNGPAGVPADGGIGPAGSYWLADSTWVSKTGPRSVRLDLDSGGLRIAPAYWLSFYASVGETMRESAFLLPGGEGTYGSWHCGGVFAGGIRNGWNCDPGVWYINPDGTFPNSKANLAHPGWTYHLRDVDCYDGRIGDTGVAVQPAYYGDEPCA